MRRRNLPCRQQSIPDQANRGHLADTEAACGFAQNKLMAFCTFALPVDRYLMRAAEIAHAQLGPGLASGRADTQPIENGGDAVVWQQAGQFAHQLLGCHIGLVAILARSVLQHFKPRVISTLPVQHEVQPTGLDCDDDLLQHGAHNPLARLDGSSCIVPERWQVTGKRHKRHRSSSPRALGCSLHKLRI